MMVREVAQRLGGRHTFRRDISTERELIHAVRAGLPAAALDYFVAALGAADIPQAAIFDLIGSTRTLQRKRTERRALSAEESDRLVRLARMLVRAEEALGNTDSARRWLTKPNRALGGERPLSLLDSDAGALAVDRELGRIEHGVFS